MSEQILLIFVERTFHIATMYRNIYNILDPEVLKDRALAYCIEHVYSWDTLSDDEQADYIRTVVQLFLENTEFKKQLFESQLN